MGFGKKKAKEVIPDIPVDMIEGEASMAANAPMGAAPKPPTKEELAKMEEIKENLRYFEENYGKIDFGDMGQIKQLLFGCLIELKKINDGMKED